MFTSELRPTADKEMNQLRKIYMRALFINGRYYFLRCIVGPVALVVVLLAVFSPSVVYSAAFWVIEAVILCIGGYFFYFRIKRFISSGALKQDLNNKQMQVLHISADAAVCLSDDHGYSTWFMRTGADEYVLIPSRSTSHNTCCNLNSKKFPCRELTILRYPCSGFILNIDYSKEQPSSQYINIVEGVSDECILMDLPALESLSGKSVDKIKALFKEQ